MITIKKEKGKKYPLDERIELVKYYQDLVGKRIVYLEVNEGKYSPKENKILINSSEVQRVEWCVFSNYPVLILSSSVCSGRKIDASRYKETLFVFDKEGIESIKSKIKDFMHGEPLALNCTLDREYEFKDWSYRTKLWSKSLKIGENEQLFKWNKKERILQVASTGEAVGLKLTVSGGDVIDLLSEDSSLVNTEEISYYVYDEIDGMLEDIGKDVEEDFILSDIRLESCMKEESLVDEQVRDMVKTVIEEKMPEIMEEVLNRLMGKE